MKGAVLKTYLKKSPDHNFLLFFGDFEYCITAYSHSNLIISGQILHGLHDQWPCSTGRLWSWPTAIFEDWWRSNLRVVAFISSLAWRWVPKLHSAFLFGINISNTIHFMLFLRKKRKCTDFIYTPCTYYWKNAEETSKVLTSNSLLGTHST